MTRLTRRQLLAASASLPLISSARAQAGQVRIGVMGDLSGYSMEIGGPGAVLATRMAVEDHGGQAAGMKVDVIQADFLNKPDVAAQIARRWFDVENVDAITDLPNTPSALAVARLGKEREKIILVAEAATPELTTGQCSPTTVHIADDTNSLAAGTAKALLERGFKSWFFLTADFGFGHQMQASAERVVRDERNRQSRRQRGAGPRLHGRARPADPGPADRGDPHPIACLCDSKVAEPFTVTCDHGIGLLVQDSRQQNPAPALYL